MPDDNNDLRERLLAQERENLVLKERLAKQEESRLNGIEKSLKILRVAIMGNETQDGIINRVWRLEEHQKTTMRQHVVEHEKLLLGDREDPKRIGVVAEVRALKATEHERKAMIKWAKGAVVGAIGTILFEVLKHFVFKG